MCFLSTGNYIMVGKKSKVPELICEGSLQGLFYDQLQIINESISRPLPIEAIHYSSMVLSKYSESKNYFEEVEGRLRDKILGIKLLECSSLPRVEQKSKLIDIGETSLMLCGMFRESLNKKLNGSTYYNELGKVAYNRLNHLVPSVYEVDSFYSIFSSYFTVVTTMVHAISKSNFDIKKSIYLCNDIELDQEDLHKNTGQITKKKIS